MNLRIVKVNDQYCNYLRKFDCRVPHNSGVKQLRPFVGIVFEINSVEYFAPLSSPKAKYERMHNTVDFMKINGGQYGAINFNNMIPVISSDYEVISLQETPEMTKDEVKYNVLLKFQLDWIVSRQNEIQDRAKKLYEHCDKGTLPSHITKRCCNFRLLEEKFLEYHC